MKKNINRLVVLFFIITVIFLLPRCGKDDNPVESGDETVHSTGLEIPAYNSTDQIVYHTAYTLQYNETYEQADWVAYYLTKDRLYGGVSRTNDYRADPSVTTESAQLSDYSGTGYNRGHLAPAADFTWSSTAMSESFYLSNMSPQIYAFNAGIWETLETWVRSWANASTDTLFIAVGPVLRSGLPTIGSRNKLAVPEYFYKAIMRKSTTGTLSAIAFLMKHESSSAAMATFAITVDSLEKITNIDFFSKLPASSQAEIESKIDTSKWPGI